MRYFAASAIKQHERGWSARPGLPPWDDRPHKPAPYSLRGQKIVSNEPWIEDVKPDPEIECGECFTSLVHMNPSMYVSELVCASRYATSSFNRLDDGQYDDNALAFRRRVQEDMAIAIDRGAPPWHRDFFCKMWPKITS